MTVGDAFSGALRRLRGTSPSARLDAGRLLEYVVRRNGAWILAHADSELTLEQSERFASYVARRAEGEPVAYVIGSAGFYGRSFSVTPDVLVPRPESELLIDIVLARFRDRPVVFPPARILDVGTGSGALALTLALELPTADIAAVDVSREALDVARRNAHDLGLGDRVVFAASDLLGDLAADTRYDAIVANLPYVPTGSLELAPDPTAFEPRLALDGGPDGLALYVRLLADVPDRLAADGLLAMEAAPGTIAPLATLAVETFGDRARVCVRADLAGLERAVVVELGGSPPVEANADTP